MKMREFLGIEKRSGRISNKTRAKLRHDYGVLISAGKPRRLSIKWLCGKWEVSLSSAYKIIR